MIDLLTISVFTLAILWVAITGLLAWLQEEFWPHQSESLTFTNHGGMWCDLLAMPFFFASAYQYALEWGWWIIPTTLVGLYASYKMHIVWAKMRPQAPCRHSSDFLIANPDIIKWAGISHTLYMACVIVLAILVYFFSGPITSTHAITMTAALSITIAIGTIQPMFFLNEGKADAQGLVAGIGLPIVLCTLCYCRFF